MMPLLFFPCDACAAHASGTPLCGGCATNRATIEQIKRGFDVIPIPRDGATNPVELSVDKARGLVTLRQTVFGDTDTIIMTRAQATALVSRAVTLIR